jgi:hypothetical protein
MVAAFLPEIQAKNGQHGYESDHKENVHGVTPSTQLHGITSA